MPSALILPMTAHVALAAFLYVLLTLARAPAVWGLRWLPGGADTWKALEPRISANLSNQFEWPMLFYAACLILIELHAAALMTYSAGLAWVFVGGRVLHSVVQILIPNIRLRGLVFTINFVAVLGLWGVVLIEALH